MIAGTYVQTDRIRGAFESLTQTVNRGTDVVVSPRESFSSDLGPPTQGPRRGAARDACDAMPGVRARRGPADRQRLARDRRRGGLHRLRPVGRRLLEPRAVRRLPLRQGRAAAAAGRRRRRPPAGRATRGCGSASTSGSARAPASSASSSPASASGGTGCRSAAPRSSCRDSPTSSAGSSAPASCRASSSPPTRASSPDAARRRGAAASCPRTRDRARPAPRTRPRQADAANDAIGSFLTPGAARALGRGAAGGRLHHLQHVLDHRRPAGARVRAAALAGRDARAGPDAPSPSRRWPSASRRPCSACSPGSGSRRCSARSSTPRSTCPRAGWCWPGGRSRSRSCVGHRRHAGGRDGAGRARDAGAARVGAARRRADRRAAARPPPRRRTSPPPSACSGCSRLLQGMFGSGPAATRLGGLAGGAVLLFVGVALVARYVVRPVAGAIGRPLALAFDEPGRLARENAMRNPAPHGDHLGRADGGPRARRLRGGLRRRASRPRSPAASTSSCAPTSR